MHGATSGEDENCVPKMSGEKHPENAGQRSNGEVEHFLSKGLLGLPGATRAIGATGATRVTRATRRADIFFVVSDLAYPCRTW